MKKGPLYRKLARHQASDLYERGWREGWQAALVQVQQDGIGAVLNRERRLDDPSQLVIPDSPRSTR